MEEQNPLTMSIDSLASSHGNFPDQSLLRGANSISKIYKQAQTLFLTRQLPEALQVIEPLITADTRDADSRAESPWSSCAPIASATKKARVKVWNLYLALVNAIIELGPDEGKSQLGNAKWRALASRAQDGTIWEDVVQAGYNGVESAVDLGVVVKLATLLLSQSQSQVENQRRLETHLATFDSPRPNQSGFAEAAIGSNQSAKVERPRTNGGHDLRHLESQLEILELYVLHVLPRNNEWQYAREFVTINQFLDEEKQEDLLQTLQCLEDQKHHDQVLEADIISQRDEALERTRDEAKGGRNDRPQRFESYEAIPKQSDGEKDYGIDDLAPKASRMNDTAPNRKDIEIKKVQGAKPARFLPRSEKPKAPWKQSSQAASKGSIRLLNALQRLASNLTATAKRSPAALLRTILFVFVLTLAMGRRDVRELLQRVSASGWERVKRTAGMGVKVSYI